jgi:hypothetical protein
MSGLTAYIKNMPQCGVAGSVWFHSNLAGVSDKRSLMQVTRVNKGAN